MEISKLAAVKTSSVTTSLRQPTAVICLKPKSSSQLNGFSSSLPQFFRISARRPAFASPIFCSNTLNSLPTPTRVRHVSAKEKRKLRQQKREEAKASQEVPWKEMVEDRLLEKEKEKKKTKKTGWEEDADISRRAANGMQWYIIQVTRNMEQSVAEQISIIFPKQFPGREFEVTVPTVPVNAVLKGGRVSGQRKKLYQSVVLLRCVLDRDVWATVRQIPHAYEFFGNFAGMTIDPIIMPAPMSDFNMEKLFETVRQAEEEHERFKEQYLKEAEARSREEKEVNVEEQQVREEYLMAKGLVLEVGATVRVLSGPLLEFTGIVSEVLPEESKIKAVVTVFGNNTTVVLNVADVTLEAAAPAH